MFVGVLSLHYVPKQARIAFSNLTEDLATLTANSTDGAFQALFMLLRLILPSRIRGNRAAARMQSLVALFRLGYFENLIENRNIVFPTTSYDCYRKAIALAKAGELGRAARLYRY